MIVHRNKTKGAQQFPNANFNIIIKILDIIQLLLFKNTALKKLNYVPSSRGTYSDGPNRKASLFSDTSNRQAETSRHVASELRMTGVERKTPVTRSSDFLW
jgi:hypothetical protein